MQTSLTTDFDSLALIQGGAFRDLRTTQHGQNLYLDGAVYHFHVASKHTTPMLVADLDTLPLRPSVRAALREAKVALERRYGDRLVKVVLYGSHARGEAHEESDVDVLVVLRGTVNPYEEARRTSGLMLEASLRHGTALSILHLEEELFNDPMHPLMMNVNEEGVEL